MNNSLFQTKEWADFKCQTGWDKQHWLDDILVLERKLPLGRSMLYSPMIGLNQKSKIKNQNDISKFKKLAQETHAVFYRLEIDTPANNLAIEQLNNLKALGFRKAFEEMQPEHTLILDISQSEEEILAQMKQKGRYNIKIAERSAINITPSSSTPGVELNRELLDHFYTLYETMAKRQKISYRGKKYFEALLEILGKKGYARVYTASIKMDHGQTDNGQRKSDVSGQSSVSSSSICGDCVPLASAIIGFYDNRATYLFGGSSNEHRNLMAPYLLHWQIIKDAKAHGCTEYDFFGIAPDDSLKHPWAGVTRFKNQFGGQEIHLAGSWDLVFKPLEYQVFKIMEKIRR